MNPEGNYLLHLARLMLLQERALLLLQPPLMIPAAPSAMLIWVCPPLMHDWGKRLRRIRIAIK
jgi:hypothetical protein